MKTQKGFTLIELMIVVAIIGLLAGIGYPAYVGQMTKARRSDAQQLILDISNKLEQHVMDARNYTADLTKLFINEDDWTCIAANCSNAFYTITITLDAGPPPTYLIQGVPVAGGTQASDGNLSLASTGAKMHGSNQGW